MENKKILVTGASGYLGGKLCHALLSRGYSVRAFVRRTSNLSSLPSSAHFDVAFGDITDFSSLLAAVSGCHFILHSAALVEPWLPDSSRFFTVNVGGLKNVIEACKESNIVQKIIYTSSFFALGNSDGGRIADENQVHHEKFFCTEYERSKVEADKIALQAAAEGVPIVAVYPGVIYGPGKLTAGNVVAKLLIERFNWRLPGYIGHGNDKFSFSYVDDVVDGHIAAVEKGCPGERYLLTGENASFKYVFDAAAILTNTSKPCLSLPMWMIEAYGWISVLVARITGKLPLLSPPMKKVVNKARIMDKKTVEVRRSARVASNPAPVYAEISLPRFSTPRKSYGIVKARDFSNRVIATDEVREYAIQEAEKLNAKLEEEGFPTLVRPMLPSHVTGGFWLGLPTDFCRRSLPHTDGGVTLVDEDGDEFPVVYLARKRGLSGGWKGFAEYHQLVDGDCVVFQVISNSTLKVYIIRGSEQGSGTD